MLGGGLLPFAALAITIFDRLRRRRNRSKAAEAAKRSEGASAASDPARRVIYLFGVDGADDPAYYSLKADTVVMTGEDPDACALFGSHFDREVRSGRLVVLNVALEADGGSDQQPSDIVQKFGAPIYVKLGDDVEAVPALTDLFGAEIFPPEISADTDLAQLVPFLADHGYRRFSLIDRDSVARDYGNAIINSVRGVRRFQFREGSAGPFGDDIRGRWQNSDDVLPALRAAAPGQMRLHAKRA